MKRWYTKEELQFIKKNLKGRSYLDMTKMFNKKFGLRITLKQMETIAHKHGFYNGIGSYNNGSPPNKGKKHKPEIGNYKPIGSERVIPHSPGVGYVEVKTGHHTWERKHTVIWKKTNGKVPKGHVVIFADGNNRNFALNNLMLVSKAELGVMNRIGLISSNKKLTEVGKTIADIKIAIGKRKRGKKNGRK
jgi:hypothetical protein